MEINKEPAINIYRYYLEERFSVFVKKRLFSLYPLRIKNGDSDRLINVIDYLGDGSLVCTGEVKEKSQANIMFLDPTFIFDNLAKTLKPLKNEKQALIFIINSLMRKQTLKDTADEEIKLIKRFLGDEMKMIGIHSEYSFFSRSNDENIDLESGNLLISLWQ